MPFISGHMTTDYRVVQVRGLLVTSCSTIYVLGVTVVFHQSYKLKTVMPNHTSVSLLKRVLAASLPCPVCCWEAHPPPCLHQWRTLHTFFDHTAWPFQTYDVWLHKSSKHFYITLHCLTSSCLSAISEPLAFLCLAASAARLWYSFSSSPGARSKNLNEQVSMHSHLHTWVLLRSTQSTHTH